MVSTLALTNSETLVILTFVSLGFLIWYGRILSTKEEKVVLG